MALIRFSNLINDIRGATGGNTFSRGASGAVVSMRKGSRRGQVARNPGASRILPTITKFWRSMSELERGSYNAAAVEISFSNKLGELRGINGFELFVRANYYRLYSIHPILPTFSPNWDLGSYKAYNASYDLSTNTLSQGVTNPVPYSGNTLRFLSDPIPASRKLNSSMAITFGNEAPQPYLSQASSVTSLPTLIKPLIPEFVGGQFWIKYVVIQEFFNWPILMDKVAVRILA